MGQLKYKHLSIGDSVNWVDPDADIGTGTYHVMEILTESGCVETIDTVVIILGINDSINEVFVSELA